MKQLFCLIFITASLLPICISNPTDDSEPLTTNNGFNRATENTRINTNPINQDELINQILAEMENRGYIWKPWWLEIGWGKKHPFYGGGNGAWGWRPSPFGNFFWNDYQGEPLRTTSQPYNHRPASSRISSPRPKSPQPQWQSLDLSPQPATATTNRQQLQQSTAAVTNPPYYSGQPATLQSTVPNTPQSLYYQARPTQSNRQSRPFTIDTSSTNRRTDNLLLRPTNVASANRRADNNELNIQRDPPIPASFGNDQITELQK